MRIFQKTLVTFRCSSLPLPPNSRSNADLFLGLSVSGVLTQGRLGSIAYDPIVFAMANPVPEIMPELAGGKARVVATGRNDY